MGGSVPELPPLPNCRCRARKPWPSDDWSWHDAGAVVARGDSPAHASRPQQLRLHCTAATVCQMKLYVDNRLFPFVLSCMVANKRLRMMLLCFPVWLPLAGLSARVQSNLQGTSTLSPIRDANNGKTRESPWRYWTDHPQRSNPCRPPTRKALSGWSSLLSPRRKHAPWFPIRAVTLPSNLTHPDRVVQSHLPSILLWLVCG